MDKIQYVQKLLKEKQLDAIIITSKVMKQYLGAITGSGNVVVITENKVLQFMDGRYQNETCLLTEVENKVLAHRDYFIEIIAYCKAWAYEKIGIETGVSITTYLKLCDNFDISIIGDELTRIRSIKDATEINKIKQACQLTDEVFTRLLPQIKVGMSEKELVGLIYLECYKAGADTLSFEPIVASGWRGSLPHGRATNKRIEVGELVTIDFGIVLNNYQSDMTRTVGVKQLKDELRTIYDVVYLAQTQAIEAIKVGIPAKNIDQVARTIITERGYGDYFTHGLGHGLGIGGDLPMLNQNDCTILSSGMVVTCEPGVYIPKLGGVRIEDDILVSEYKGISLTKSEKNLLLVGV